MTDGLAFVELATLVVAADHPLAGQDSVRLSALADEPHVMLEGPGSRQYFEGLLAESGINPPISYISTSLESVRSAVASGFGFILLVMRPPSTTTYDGGAVKTLEIEDDLQSLRVVLASREWRRSYGRPGASSRA